MVTVIIHKTYFILSFDIILNITYIKINIHIEYSINSIENNKTINHTIIYDFNIAINNSYLSIKTSESYVTISNTTVITYVGTEKTRYQHIKTTVSESYETIGDSDIFGYLSIITDECFRAIGDILFIEYMGATKTSNVRIETSEPYITIKETTDMKHNILDDIVFGWVGKRCGDHPVITSRGGVKYPTPPILAPRGIQDIIECLGSRLCNAKKKGIAAQHRMCLS